MFEIEELDTNIFSVKVSGKLTHEDYVKHLIPTLEKAISNHRQVSLLIEATDFHGWEWRAALDDFKTAIKHRKDFLKIAIVGDQAWEKYLVSMFGFFINAEIRYYDNNAVHDARVWITE